MSMKEVAIRGIQKARILDQSLGGGRTSIIISMEKRTQKAGPSRLAKEQGR
jgi:hypothetical protein